MLKRSRIVIMVVLVFAILVFYIFQLMQYQVTDGEAARLENSKSTINKLTILAPRGEILDRYGRVLATNTVGYNIVIESAFFPSSSQTAKQNAELLELTDIFTQDKETWEDSLPISRTEPYAYTGTKGDTSALIKYVNSLKSQNDPTLQSGATAAQVIAELERIYSSSGYTEAQRRTLVGIRYEMAQKSFSYTKVFTLAENVSITTVTKIEERSDSIPGAVAQEAPVRSYPDGTIAPHVIGLTGPIYADELSEYKSKGYSATDTIGKFGIEQSMESYLHGVNGTQQVVQNSNGDVTSSMILQQPKPGDNVVLTIDKDLQVTMQNSLPQIVSTVKEDSNGNPKYGADVQGAAAVVMDIKTGEVLAMATYPSFNLNTYRQNYSALANNSLDPLLDRADAGTYRPGSTFKPITATAGMMKGIITPTTVWDCPPQFTRYAPSYVGSDDDGEARDVNVEGALEVSSNVFFDTLGDKLGMRTLEATAINIFGIGRKTGIELDDEASGIMSGYGYAQAEDIPVNPADAAQAAIGQLYTKLTPLQMASYLSTLMRGGTQYQVHVVKQVNNYNNTKVIVNNNTPKVVSKTVIPQDIVDTIKQGMLQVTVGDSGTATTMFKGFDFKVGGKTGTAQIGSLSSPNVKFNGVFICFAPYDNPDIAVSVVVEQGHNGYQVAPVGKTAIEKYFGIGDNGMPLPSIASTTKTGSLLQ